MWNSLLEVFSSYTILAFPLRIISLEYDVSKTECTHRLSSPCAKVRRRISFTKPVDARSRAYLLLPPDIGVEFRLPTL